MQICSPTCIPACLTCQEFEDHNRTDGKGLCTLNMSDPAEVDGLHWCKKFKCINLKD
jgi:hypothetical protein